MSPFDTAAAAANAALLATFGESVTYTPAVGDPVVLLMTVEDPRQLGETADGSYKLFGLPTANAPAGVTEGRTITRASGAVYKIFRIEAGEAGWTRLAAQKQ